MTSRFVSEYQSTGERAKRVWFVGDASRDEFTRPLSWLQRNACTVVIRDLSSAMELAGERSPDLIVLAASVPGQFRAPDVDQVRSAAPRAEWVYLFGGWCTGETRTGRPLPGMTRIDATHFAGRLGGNWSGFLAGARPWDVLSTESGQPIAAQTATARQSIVFATAGTQSSQQLAMALVAAGHSCRQLGEIQPGARDNIVDLIVWDDAWDVRRGPPALSLVRQLIPQAPIIALLTAPRVGDRLGLLPHGVVETLSKPFLIDDLLRVIDGWG